MKAVTNDCGFSCTYAKKKTYEMLENLLKFAEYDPETAEQVIDEIGKNVDYARRVIHVLNLQ